MNYNNEELKKILETRLLGIERRLELCDLNSNRLGESLMHLNIERKSMREDLAEVFFLIKSMEFKK